MFRHLTFDPVLNHINITFALTSSAIIVHCQGGNALSTQSRTTDKRWFYSSVARQGTQVFHRTQQVSDCSENSLLTSAIPGPSGPTHPPEGSSLWWQKSRLGISGKWLPIPIHLCHVVWSRLSIFLSWIKHLSHCLTRVSSRCSYHKRYVTAH
jgi:hypothetical protein